MRNFVFGILFVLALIASFCFGKSFCGDCKDNIVVRTDTIRVTETIADTIFISRFDTIFLRSVDTLYNTDTIRVVVPISTYRFEEKGLYDITASGFHLSIDSIKVFPKTEIRYAKDERRLSVGLQTGLGVSASGLSPYVGIGINYRLFYIGKH